MHPQKPQSNDAINPDELFLGLRKTLEGVKATLDDIRLFNDTITDKDEILQSALLLLMQELTRLHAVLLFFNSYPKEPALGPKQ